MMIVVIVVLIMIPVMVVVIPIMVVIVITNDHTVRPMIVVMVILSRKATGREKR
jgi:hypothetical protein